MCWVPGYLWGGRWGGEAEKHKCRLQVNGCGQGSGFVLAALKTTHQKGGMRPCVDQWSESGRALWSEGCG